MKIMALNPRQELAACTLAIDCGACAGLCCAALCFSKSDGFPADKAAGKPCGRLTPDFRCSIHAELPARGLRGCVSYDCFGAGQKATRMARGLAPDQNWRTAPETAERTFGTFLAVYRLHQMLWYLIQAAALPPARALWEEAGALIAENARMGGLEPEALLALDTAPYRQRVNRLLKRAGAAVSAAAGGAPAKKPGNYMGRKLGGKRLEGRDFSMSLLIAADLEGTVLRGANFLGADLRDARVQGADLSESVFLTQGQINAARGDRRTKLPAGFVRPASWV